MQDLAKYKIIMQHLQSLAQSASTGAILYTGCCYITPVIISLLLPLFRMCWGGGLMGIRCLPLCLVSVHLLFPPCAVQTTIIFSQCFRMLLVFRCCTGKKQLWCCSSLTIKLEMVTASIARLCQYVFFLCQFYSGSFLGPNQCQPLSV